jgi:type I restriction enzyme R subunit
MTIKYSEYTDSQLPALEFLQALGWKYISPEETVSARGEILSNVILEDILTERLQKINSFEYKGENYKFSKNSISAAINALRNISDEGLVVTNEKVYDLLTLGKSFTESIDGDMKAFSLRYIDWQNPKNNVYHITQEFVVDGGRDKRRPDLVLFVNGIPFVVIENKRRDKNESIDEAISQNIRNQKSEEGIPRLFHYAQLLLAVHPNEVKYGATGTPAKFWAVWKEDVDKEVTKLLGESRLPTAQDRGLYSLCKPDRLMDIVYKYIVFDGPDKKICRYQQYFAVQDTIERVTKFDKNGNRKGGGDLAYNRIR